MSEDHALDRQSYDEPVGGWVRGPELIDTEIQLIKLCRYSGHPVGDQGCLLRYTKRHPDEECRTYFISTKVLRERSLDLEQLDLEALPDEVRATTMGESVAVTDGV